MGDKITFRFSGGEQYLVDLDRWRERLKSEVHEAARQETALIASVVRDQYPQGKTGNLRRGVRAKDESAGDGILFRVRSLAQHSHLYEKGTMRRRTLQGWNRGVMPARPIFIPEAITRRDAFKRSVRQILGSPEPALGRGNPTVTGSL